MSQEHQHIGPSLGTVILFSTRMRELSEFYRLGLSIGPYEESPRHTGCFVGHVYLGFDQVDEQPPAPESNLGPTLWFTVDDIHATFDHLVALGACVRYPPTEKPHTGLLASLRDPDGNIFGIAQRVREPSP